MWSALNATDIDGDGDIDFLLGNCGYNDQFSKTSAKQPMQLFVNDFDDNGTLDPILCYYIQGKSYPMASRDELLDQIVPLKKKYVKYKDYADATLADIFPAKKIEEAQVFYCDELASGILVNDGKGQFTFKAFPLLAQASKMFSIIPMDIDKDGRKDLLCSGNYYPYRVQLGQSDASLGLLLKAAAGNLVAIDPAISGAYIDGDVRAMVEVKTKAGNSLVIVAKNNDAIQVLKTNAR